MQRTAESYLDLPRRRYFAAIELHAVIIGSIAAGVLILGWGLNIDLLRRIAPGLPTMKVVTSVGFMLLSLSCLTSLRPSRRSALVSVMCASLVVIGAVIFLFIPNEPEWMNTWMQLPSKATLACLAAGGLAMLIVGLAPQYSMLAGGLALLGAIPAFYRVVALVLFSRAPEPHSTLDTMALHTAFLLVWFLIVCVLLHPKLVFANAILQVSLRGRLLRRALPIMAGAPVLAAAISMALTLLVGFSNELIFAMTATLSVMLGVGLIWWFSSLVEVWQKEANAQAARLSRANEALEQYASSAAHDLKAPARHVMLYSELLEDALKKGDTTTALRHARSIRDSAAEMPTMIEGMLDYSRSGFTRISLAQNSLSELVQAAAALNAADLEANEGKVIVVTEAKLYCDSTLLTTVLQNLIANAIKSRRHDAPPIIRITAAKEDGMVKIAVEDNGRGFDPEFAVVAFNPLARGVHTAGGEGTGIGLSTCRNIIQSHGGEIRVDPTFKGGARIEFTLPAAPPKEA